jgi:hypothetical protein
LAPPGSSLAMAKCAFDTSGEARTICLTRQAIGLPPQMRTNSIVQACHVVPLALFQKELWVGPAGPVPVVQVIGLYSSSATLQRHLR